VRYLCALLVMVPAALAAQVVRYEVSVPSPSERLFHVKADFPARGKDTLYVSLPAWSPGAYEIQNYARYVRHFAARNAAGQTLFWDRADKDTWRIATGRSERVTVEFDYLADSIDLSLGRIVDDFGEVLGTNLFLFEEGQLARPAEVRFALPSGWQVTTALRGTGGGPYRAADYDELADAMTFVGKYALDSVQVDAHWIRIAMWPAADYTPAVQRNFRGAVEKMARLQNQLMGGPPYDAYTIFFNVIHGPVGFGGGLEHSASQYDIMPAEAFADPSGRFGDFMLPLLSHEFFHLWNVKRIRPAEMWPYDYRGEQYTPLLWWSEGVTDYYADLTNLRAGLWADSTFLANVTANIQQVEAAPEPWSEEDGSVATWINEVYVNSSQLYYPKGSLTGLLLDVSIRDATDNKYGLDDVMRALYARFYKQGKGFRTSDLLALLTEMGLPDAAGFYHRYINGREPLPYDSILPRAGIVVNRRTSSLPFLGVTSGPTPDGQLVVQAVSPGSAAGEAGVAPGDVLLKIGDVAVTPDSDWGAAFRTRYRGQGGQPFVLTVRRGDQTLTLNSHVHERTVTSFRLERSATATTKQARIWRGLATGTTGS
jgi:predicted metalloprotease with PDZ domain